MTWIAPGCGLPVSLIDELSSAEILAALYDPNVWLRPNQRLPEQHCKVWALVCGRGFGKTEAGAAIVVQRARDEGSRIADPRNKRIIVAGPNEPRVEQTMLTAICSASPPWFPAEQRGLEVRWPNGVRAIGFTAESPEKPRGENAFLAWLDETSEWQPNKVIPAFENIYQATRIGRAQIVVTTTPKAGSLLLGRLQEMSARDPRLVVIQNGTTYDNPLPTIAAEGRRRFALYERNENDRRYREEVLGEIFAEAAGALFTQAKLNAHRLDRRRNAYDIVLVGLDPTLSARDDADECGIVVAGRAGAHVDVLDDRSGRYPVETWAHIAISACVDNGARGIVCETNNVGTAPEGMLRVAAQSRGMKFDKISRATDNARSEPFPAPVRNTIYFREIATSKSKLTRAEGPAALCNAGRLHMVGAYPELETELVTFEGGSKSPNRYDALMHVVTEIADLTRDAPETPAVALAKGAADDLRARLRRIGTGRGRVL